MEQEQQKNLINEIEKLKKHISELESLSSRHSEIEKNLKDSENKFKDIFNKTADGMHIIDIGTKQTFDANETMCRMLGYTLDEMLKLGLDDIHRKDDLPYIIEQFKLLARKKISLARNIPVKKKNGTILYADVNASSIMLGGKMYLMGVYRDVTERKRVEERINQQSEFIGSVLTSITNPFYVIDANDYSIIMASPSARLTGDSELSTCYSVMFKKDKPCEDVDVCPVKEVKKTKKPVRVEHYRYDKDGNLKPFEVHAYPVFDNDGNVIQIIEYATDISDIKLAQEREKELIALAAAAEVERRRSAELEKANQELKETTMQLIQSEKLSALGELTAGVTHELNQPLNVMKLICKSIIRDVRKERYEKENAEKAMSEIVGQIDKMADIINHMRVFTRRSDGAIPEPVDLNFIVEDTFRFFGQQLQDHGIKLRKILDPNLPKIMGDPIQLEQVLSNLIINARDALDKNEKLIEVKTYKLEPAKVVVEVSDNGPGVPDNLADKIFTPFFTTKEKGKGTGLGLSITKKIIDQHKGKIELNSKPGRGAAFKIILPVFAKVGG